jgi:hypothetical protein
MCNLLNAKIWALEQQHPALLSVASSPPVLTLSTPIQDDQGDCVTTLGSVLQEKDNVKWAN